MRNVSSRYHWGERRKGKHTSPCFLVRKYNTLFIFGVGSERVVWVRTLTDLLVNLFALNDHCEGGNLGERSQAIKYHKGKVMQFKGK